jgi:hypothetical protein
VSKFLTLLILGAILAVLRAVLIALVVAVVMALLVAFITRPRDTLVFLVCLGLLGLAGAHPLACIITLGVVAVVSVAANAKPKARPQVLLTDGREHNSN